jgi:hypothetical protein
MVYNRLWNVVITISSEMDVLDGHWEANKLTKGTYKFADGDV